VAEAARVTVVVVPSDRFSVAPSTRCSRTAPPFDLVEVDAASPRPLRRWLRDQSVARGF
jgi:hypothetical protein